MPHQGVSRTVAASLLLIGILIGSVGYYGVSVLTSGKTTTSSIATRVQSSQETVASSTTTSRTYTEGQSTYALSQKESVDLGWALNAGSGVSSTAANSITLVVTNLGEYPITELSYELASVLGPIAGTVPLAPSTSETLQDVFVGGVDFAQQATLKVNVTYSDGESFSIPQPIDVNYTSYASLYALNTQSAFCSGLLSTISMSNFNAFYANSYLGIAYTGTSTIGLAAFVISDPLNSNGLRVTSVPAYTLTSSGTPFFSIGSPNFISGKQYSLQLQLGEPSPTLSDVIYAPSGFCTLSLTFTPIS